MSHKNILSFVSSFKKLTVFATFLTYKGNAQCVPVKLIVLLLNTPMVLLVCVMEDDKE